MRTQSLSIVVPVLNEASRNPSFPQLLSRLGELSGVCDVLFVDGDSQDTTTNLIEQAGMKVASIGQSNRAQRLNAGIARTSGDMVLLHHPRSILPAAAIHYLFSGADLQWGGFTHQFDMRHPLLAFTSWYSNRVRPRSQRIVYLDHCIYARRSLLALAGPIPEIDIFEDSDLSRALGRYARPKILPFPSVTSAIRFQEGGIYRHALKNQLLKLAYYARLSHKQMNKIYEQRLGLNADFEKGSQS